MTAALQKLKSHFANWRQWELNPIVIKELRQAVRSWAVTGMLLLFLTVLFITSVGMLLNQSVQVEVNRQFGAQVFAAFLVILAISSMIFIPLYLGIRLAAERVASNTDLLYISTLTPGRIIRGKFLCGMYMAVLFFSACMPFMAFTNLLRGVDLPSVFIVLFFLFCVVCALNQVAIFIACLPLSRPFKVFVGLFGICWCVGAIFPVLFSAFAMMSSGVGAMFGARYFWDTFFTTAGIVLAFVGLLHVLSIALISPPSANRALPIRIYVTVVWMLGGLVAFVWMVKTSTNAPLLVWTFETLFVMSLALIAIVSNQDKLSQRVRHKIPARLALRLPAFLFFNGAAGGLIWIAIISGVTWLATPNEDEAPLISAAITCYTFAFSLTALFIQRTFLPRRTPRIAGLLVVLLTAGMAVLPAIFLFLTNQLNWQTIEHLQLGNMFNVFSDRANREVHLIFALAWMAIAMVLNARWFWRQWKNFRPLDRNSVEPIPTPPVIQ